MQNRNDETGDDKSDKDMEKLFYNNKNEILYRIQSGYGRNGENATR